MPIIEDAILGQDCNIQLESASYNLTVINWDNAAGNFEKEQMDFNVAQSTTSGFVVPRKRTPTVTLSGKRGLGETFLDLQKIYDDEEITNFTMTDFPTHSDMVAEYGPPQMVSLQNTQPGEFGTYTLTIRWGSKSHGYTPV